MTQTIKISELMETSGVKFGTSGARGRVEDMTDRVCYAYTLGFLQHMEAIGDLAGSRGRVAIAGDLRPSTDRIMAAAARAITDRGYDVVHCGHVPSPTVALYGLSEKIPSLMVTGSHIPDDRNGIKYNKVAGEVLKNDEAGMKAQEVALPDLFDKTGALIESNPLPTTDPTAVEAYMARYLGAFSRDCLDGLRLGLYEHSAVGRDLIGDIFAGLGATVVPLGRSERFIPVDTEAIRPEDVELAAAWSKEHGFDAIISTDGDSDRPLISDENGKWVRGDVAGVLTASFLNADAVVTPVSCNTAVEKSERFAVVERTRIGSPFVIAGMQAQSADGRTAVVGYEANGGFLTNSPISIDGGRTLAPLPTRDPVIVQLAILCASKQAQKPISHLLADLPQRVTASDRLKEFPRDKSLDRIDALTNGGTPEVERAFPFLGKAVHTNSIDGLRITFENQEVVHLRPSGNAPELRCYTEADSEDRAVQLMKQVLDVMEGWR